MFALSLEKEISTGDLKIAKVDPVLKDGNRSKLG